MKRLLVPTGALNGMQHGEGGGVEQTKRARTELHHSDTFLQHHGQGDAQHHLHHGAGAGAGVGANGQLAPGSFSAAMATSPPPAPKCAVCLWPADSPHCYHH